MQSPPSRMQGGDDPDAVIVLSSCFFFSPFRHSLTRPLPRRFRVTGPSGKGESAADGRRWLWRGASSSFIKYALAGHRCLQGCLRTRGPMQMAAPRARLPRPFRPGTTLALAGPLPAVRRSVRPIHTCFAACVQRGRCETVNCAALRPVFSDAPRRWMMTLRRCCLRPWPSPVYTSSFSRRAWNIPRSQRVYLILCACLPCGGHVLCWLALYRVPAC